MVRRRPVPDAHGIPPVRNPLPGRALTPVRIVRGALLLAAATVAAFLPSRAPAAAALGLARSGSQVRIAYAGILQSAPTPGGPWTDLPAAPNPCPVEIATTGEGPRFFRSRVAEPGSVFASGEVVSWILHGPFQTHFEAAYAGLPDGIFPPRREKLPFDGTLTADGRTLPVTLRVRGNSSLQECPFPKLKLKVSREVREGTGFADAREIKIGTHCAEGGRGSVGRLRDETATWREATAYEAMDALGFVTPRVRRARIEYHDTSPGRDPAAGGWPVERQALIFDDAEVVAEQRAGRALSDDEVAALSATAFDEQTVVDLQFLHALLGNWDYRLEPGRSGVWNADVLQLADGAYVPVAGDFDLSSWVTGTVRSGAPRDYRPEMPDVEREARFQLEQLAGRLKPGAYASARARFELRRTRLETTLDIARIDEPGRANARRHVAAFFEALAAIPAP